MTRTTLSIVSIMQTGNESTHPNSIILYCCHQNVTIIHLRAFLPLRFIIFCLAKSLYCKMEESTSCMWKSCAFINSHTTALKHGGPILLLYDIVGVNLFSVGGTMVLCVASLSVMREECALAASWAPWVGRIKHIWLTLKLSHSSAWLIFHSQHMHLQRLFIDL